ncbi:inner centromere protein A-like [Argonauta hians]
MDLPVPHTLGLEFYEICNTFIKETIEEFEEHYTWLDEILETTKAAFQSSYIQVLPKTPSAKAKLRRTRRRQSELSCNDENQPPEETNSDTSFGYSTRSTRQRTLQVSKTRKQPTRAKSKLIDSNLTPQKDQVITSVTENAISPPQTPLDKSSANSNESETANELPPNNVIVISPDHNKSLTENCNKPTSPVDREHRIDNSSYVIEKTNSSLDLPSIGNSPNSQETLNVRNSRNCKSTEKIEDIRSSQESKKTEIIGSSQDVEKTRDIKCSQNAEKMEDIGYFQDAEKGEGSECSEDAEKIGTENSQEIETTKDIVSSQEAEKIEDCGSYQDIEKSKDSRSSPVAEKMEDCGNSEEVEKMKSSGNSPSNVPIKSPAVKISDNEVASATKTSSVNISIDSKESTQSEKVSSPSSKEVPQSSTPERPRTRTRRMQQKAEANSTASSQDETAAVEDSRPCTRSRARKRRSEDAENVVNDDTKRHCAKEAKQLSSGSGSSQETHEDADVEDSDDESEIKINSLINTYTGSSFCTPKQYGYQSYLLNSSYSLANKSIDRNYSLSKYIRSGTLSSSAQKISTQSRLGMMSGFSHFKSLLKKSSTPVKAASKEIIEMKKKELETKQRRARERLMKQEEIQRLKLDEHRKKREERMRRVAEARQMREMQEQVQKSKKIEEKLMSSDRFREEKLREEKEKVRLRLKRQQEAEERRKLEEKIRNQKRKEQEEEQLRQETILQRKREFEEQERLKKAANEKRKMEEQRERKLEVEREKINELEKRKRLEEEREKERLRLRAEREKDIAKLRAEQEYQSKSEKMIEREKEIARQHAELEQQSKVEKMNESYKMTPQRISCYNYDISDLKEDDSTDDESNPSKPIPRWALNPELKIALLAQHYNPPNLDKIFHPIENPDLNELFVRKRARFNHRSSSAHWDAPIMRSHIPTIG